MSEVFQRFTAGLVSAKFSACSAIVRTMKNILLIRLSSLGDIVLTSPAIRAVRQHFPQARISMLVAKQSADLLTENPHLDEVIPFDRKAGNKDTGEMRRIIRRLRERRFDLAIDFQRKFRTSLLAYLSGAKCRVGYHQPNGVLCTVRVPDLDTKAIRAGRISSAHAIDRYFDLLHPIGVEDNRSDVRAIYYGGRPCFCP